MKSTNKIHQILMDHKEMIIQKEKDGVSIAEIAQEYNVHFVTIYDFLRECGIKRTYKRNSNIAEHKEEIIHKYREGIPIKVIAKDENVSMYTIYKYLIKWNIRGRRERIINEGYRERRKFTIEKKVSPELLAKREENTRTNNKYMKFYKIVETVHDKFLVQSMIEKIGGD